LIKQKSYTSQKARSTASETANQISVFASKALSASNKTSATSNEETDSTNTCFETAGASIEGCSKTADEATATEGATSPPTGAGAESR
jgi:hypothetical protein